MFQLDDAFLQKIGIADWPPEARQRFVDNFRQVLELRVGTVLSDGLSEVQLNEFESRRCGHYGVDRRARA